MAGAECNVYGNDITDLRLLVECQSQQRLQVSIRPKHLVEINRTLNILDPNLIPQPRVDRGASCAFSDLNFTWSNSNTESTIIHINFLTNTVLRYQ